jgi:hypothetical protein
VHIGVVDVYNRGLTLRNRPIDQRDAGFADNNRRQGDPSAAERELPPNDRRDDDERIDRDQQISDDVYGKNEPDKAQSQGEGYGSFPKGKGSQQKAVPNAISQSELDDLRPRVSTLITDSDKEQLMKKALEGRSIYSDQVRQMLSWFAFESSRLEFAKWTYSKVIDKADYWKLEDEFEFSASKKEFRSAID